MTEKDKIIKTDTKTVNVLNTFFSTIISNLNISEYPLSDSISNNINNDPVLKTILKYKDHSSIKSIEKISKLNSLFKFSDVEKGEIIVNLDVQKSCQDTDIPTKIIKENADIFTDFTHQAIDALSTILFRPIRMLKNISKVYERVMFKKIGDFMENVFSKFQCDFRKGYSKQQCLIVLIEKWKSATDKGKPFGALLTDLSKPFDCLPHELWIAILHAHGFSLAALRFPRLFF